MGNAYDWMSLFLSTSVKYQTNEYLNEWMNEEEEVWKKK